MEGRKVEGWEGIYGEQEGGGVGRYIWREVRLRGGKVYMEEGKGQDKGI